MIRIVDYGLGNVLAFQNVYKRLNIDVGVARCADDLRDASKVILPGVGAFDRAMSLLDGSGMRVALEELALGRRVPVLGVCVGMQMLASGSDEGRAAGLGWIDGRVVAFKAAKIEGLPLPHMGWNDVCPTRQSELFDGLETGARFYFLHSYYFQCANEADVVAYSRYGLEFGAAVRKDNIYGVQFHPEKSHHFGARLLKNFAGL